MHDVSFVISTHNNAKTLKECIESVLYNNFKNYTYQLIVVDDGSIDETKNILKELEKNIEITLVLKDKNEGTLLSRLDGASYADGKYITFIDADDKLTGDIFKRLDEIFAIKADIVEFNFRYCYSDGHSEQIEKVPPTQKVLAPSMYIKDIIEGKLPIALWHRYYSTDLLKKIVDNLRDIKNFRKKMMGNVLDDPFLSPIIFGIADSYYISDQVNYNYTIFSETSIQKKKVPPRQIKQNYLRFKIYLKIIEHDDDFSKYLKKKMYGDMKFYVIYKAKWIVKKILKID